ncbi:MAG TPA: hypothetical protein VFV50_14625, partial [Bdellovibrionales bacterium]|nr:hypothetical protein [Bdellovibrionales bacterium]
VKNVRLREPKPALKEAHRAATLEDLTVDIPLSTSDYYLWQWSKLIESAQFKPRNGADPKAAQELYQLAASEPRLDQGSDELLERSAFTAQMAGQIKAAHPKLAPLVTSAGYKQLLGAIDRLEKQVEENDQLWEELEDEWNTLVKTEVYPVWKKAFEAGHDLGLSELEGRLEAQLFGKHEGELEHDFGWWGTITDISIMTLSVKTIRAPKEAEALSEYLATRNERIRRWLIAYDPAKAVLVGRLEQIEKAQAQLNDESDLLQKQHGLLRRLAIYRAIGAAWLVLERLDDQKALSDVKALLACEDAKL